MALLLLRGVFATALLIQGSCYLREPDPTPGAVAVGLISLGAGVLLLVGLVTPIAAASVGLAGIAIAFSIFPSCPQPLFSSGIPLLFAVSILVVIIILGPGEFSVDARLFGRREIIIPRRSDL